MSHRGTEASSSNEEPSPHKRTMESGMSSTEDAGDAKKSDQQNQQGGQSSTDDSLEKAMKGNTEELDPNDESLQRAKEVDHGTGQRGTDVGQDRQTLEEGGSQKASKVKQDGKQPPRESEHKSMGSTEKDNRDTQDSLVRAMKHPAKAQPSTTEESFEAPTDESYARQYEAPTQHSFQRDLVKLETVREELDDEIHWDKRLQDRHDQIRAPKERAIKLIKERESKGAFASRFVEQWKKNIRHKGKPKAVREVFVDDSEQEEETDDLSDSRHDEVPTREVTTEDKFLMAPPMVEYHPKGIGLKPWQIRLMELRQIKELPMLGEDDLSDWKKHEWQTDKHWGPGSPWQKSGSESSSETSSESDKEAEKKDSKECECKMGKPENMYRKGHELNCKVYYPTADPCIFTDAPLFRGRMRFTNPCGKQKRRKKKQIAVMSRVYRTPSPHYRHTILLEDQRREDFERHRVHVLTPWTRAAQTKLLRRALPVLGPREIRQYRLPFFQWVVLDLEEDNFPETAAIIRQLLAIGKTLRDAEKSVKFRWENHMLEDYPTVARVIVKALVDAERAWRSLPAKAEVAIDSLLNCALYLMRLSEGFFWVSEQLLKRAIESATNYKRDCSHREAIVRYVYGDLLCKCMGNLPLAQEQLQTSRFLSLSKKWTIDIPQLNVPYKSLNLQATYLLCSVMMEIAKQIRAVNTIRAIQILSKALRFLGEPALVEMTACILLELGVSYEMNGDFRMAQVVMQRYLEIPHRSLDPPGKCSAYLEMAFCHRILGENFTAEAYLQETLRTAEQAGSRELLAVTNKYVGIGYLAMGSSKKASRHLQLCFRGFRELGLNNDMDYARVVAAISKGTEVMPHIAELLNTIEDATECAALTKLLRWRLRHEPFWDVESDETPDLYDSDLYNVIRTRVVNTDRQFEEESVYEEEEEEAKKDNISSIITEGGETRNSILKSPRKVGSKKWLPKGRRSVVD